jgi:glycosyltransferase involved in cell wall biosynthesis
MKIGIFLDSFFSHFSGVTNYVSLLAEGLKTQGHKVLIFSYCRKNNISENYVTIKGIKGPRDYYFGFNIPKKALKLAKELDVIHVQHPIFSGFQSIAIGKANNIPIIYTHHTRTDFYFSEYLPEPISRIAYFAYSLYMKWFLNKVDRIISPSTDLLELLLDWKLPKNYEIIHNPVKIIPRISNESDSTNQTTLIYSGRFESEKNLFFLLSAYLRVHQKIPQSRLILVGDGKQISSMKDFVKKNNLKQSVFFTGWISHHKVITFLTQADVFVSSSRSEVFPLSALEALSCGLPIVAIKSYGYNDIVTNGINGFLTEPKIGEYSKQIINLLSNEIQLREMRKNAFDSAKKYSLNKHVNQILHVYKRLTIKNNLI